MLRSALSNLPRSAAVPPSTTKTARLRKMLYQYDHVSYMMEAHSGLSGRIVEEAGFQCIWASGLSISASMGVRDANEASVSEVVQVADYINQATDIPILLDGDTGFGNFNNARRLVQRLEQLGISGVCFEDKIFPKTNSFITKASGPQPLADPNEFALKITSCKQAQTNPDFVVVARVEALICEHSMDEAIARADLYRQAGADAILIHSKKKDGAEIREFLTRWKRRHPVIIVPTTYYTDIEEEELRKLGVTIVIWANHNLRASTKAMQEVSQLIHRSRQIKQVEHNKLVVPVKEVFRLQREEALDEDEKIYLPTNNSSSHAHAHAHAAVPSELNGVNGHAVNGVNGSHANGTTHDSKHVHHLTTTSSYAPSGFSGVCPGRFVKFLKESGYRFIVGVPDSLLDHLLQCLPTPSTMPFVDHANTNTTNTLFHHIAANEGAALSIAAGYSVATASSISLKAESSSEVSVGDAVSGTLVRPPIVYLQNSGIGNLINPLLSLTHRQVYSIPCLVIVGWRGNPSIYGARDEPQHRVQGECMLDLLRAMNMETYILPNDEEESQRTILYASKRCVETQQPVFVVVRAGTFNKPPASAVTASSSSSSVALTATVSSPVKLLCRREALSVVDSLTSSSSWSAKVGSTGKLSRELYEICQAKTTEPATTTEALKQYFLMVGSMGHALSFTAGLVYGGVKGNVCCIDGDGSLIMHAGALVTVNSLPAGSRLLHVSLNNRMHESVGTQPTATVYDAVSLSTIAKGCGYQRAVTVSNVAEATAYINEFEKASKEVGTDNKACWFMEWVIGPTPAESGKALSRPAETPVSRKQAFIQHLQTTRTQDAAVEATVL